MDLKIVIMLKPNRENDRKVRCFWEGTQPFFFFEMLLCFTLPSYVPHNQLLLLLSLLYSYRCKKSNVKFSMTLTRDYIENQNTYR